ncbi:CUB and sushi domain-containing protein 1 [Desmophyllum pertusum]|uniref:CUB and sushi domain-containing protein 1 n=1 Tax=Desmophyllum pertusum TaxID=174260 RepID=A0A9X0CWK5_9CNID|nr:CUB and sushi domain-containing protein 1 [Desmophyllum pertusum]
MQVAANGTLPPPTMQPGNSTYPPVSTNPPWVTTSPPNGNSTNPPWVTTSPPNACGSIQFNQLTSPGYPFNNYPNNLNCTNWIHIPHGYAMRINFVFFRVACRFGYDYLKITNERSQSFGTFCGMNRPSDVIVTGHYVRFIFHTDSFETDLGFKLTLYLVGNISGNASTPTPYTTYPPYNPCGSIQFNQLTSPGYPFNNYPNNLNCTNWIHIPHGYAMRINFVFFRVACSFGYDYLKITNERSQSFGTFCGMNRPSDVIVTGHYVRFIFHTDSFETNSGFNLTLYPVVISGNASTPAPYTTYPPYNSTATPSQDPQSKLRSNLNTLQGIIDEMNNIVNNELSGNVSVRDYKARVKRALTDVHAAVKSGGRQKRDVMRTMMIDQLENKAADMMKQLETKEARYKKRAMMKKKLDMLAPRKA